MRRSHYRRNRCIGQSTAEYAIVIAVVIGAAVGMQTFVKRALQARYKVATDTLIDVDANKAGANATDFALFKKQSQYEPYYATTNYTNDRNAAYNETIDQGNLSRSGVLDQSNRTGSSTEMNASGIAGDDGWDNTTFP